MPWMPTVVAKGRIFLEFDDLLATSAGQALLLDRLRTILGNNGDLVMDLKNAGGLGLFKGAEDAKHTKEDWFGYSRGSRSSFFRTLSLPEDPTDPGKLDVNGYAAVGAPTDGVVQVAEELIAHGMVEALETALGLDDGGDIPAVLPEKDRPIEIFWVCGKGSGFEVEIAFNSRQVTFFIVTPPINSTVDTLANIPGDDVRKVAKQNRDRRGMTLVRATSGSDSTPVKQLMSRYDGGIDDPD